MAVMSDAQIAETYIALWERVDSEFNTLSLERQQASEDMLDRYAADLRDLARIDPQRLRNLLAGFMTERTASLVPAVATTVESLVDYDYLFTKNALIWVLKAEFSFAGDPNAPDYAWERALEATMRLLRHRLSPEQVADFHGALEERGMWAGSFDYAAYRR